MGTEQKKIAAQPQIKRERNAVKDTRPSAKLSYARVSVQKACFVLDAIRGKSLVFDNSKMPVLLHQTPTPLNQQTEYEQQSLFL